MLLVENVKKSYREPDGSRLAILDVPKLESTRKFVGQRSFPATTRADDNHSLQLRHGITEYAGR